MVFCGSFGFVVLRLVVMSVSWLVRRYGLMNFGFDCWVGLSFILWLCCGIVLRDLDGVMRWKRCFKRFIVGFLNMKVVCFVVVGWVVMVSCWFILSGFVWVLYRIMSGLGGFRNGVLFLLRWWRRLFVCSFWCMSICVVLSWGDDCVKSVELFVCCLFFFEMFGFLSVWLLMVGRVVRLVVGLIFVKWVLMWLFVGCVSGFWVVGCLCWVDVFCELFEIVFIYWIVVESLCFWLLVLFVLFF